VAAAADAESSGVRRITSQAEFDALPPGPFIGPDGQLRNKP